MRATAIVVAYELFDDQPEVPLVERDEVVEALAADRANQCRGVRPGAGCALPALSRWIHPNYHFA